MQKNESAPITSAKKQDGFTILELMIATTIFSLVLMICLAGIVQITRMYYQGVTSIRTQSTARALIDEVGETIRFSKDTVSRPVSGEETLQVYCIGTKRYSYLIDRQLSQDPDNELKQSRHVLWVDQPESGCADSAENAPADMNVEDPSLGTGGVELLGENMRLGRFEITPISEDEVYRLDLTVVYGDTDLIEYENDLPARCRTGFVGSEFCAVSNISVTVDRRL